MAHLIPTPRRSGGNGGLIWPHCGGLNWPHLRPTCDSPDVSTALTPHVWAHFIVLGGLSRPIRELLFPLFQLGLGLRIGLPVTGCRVCRAGRRHPRGESVQLHSADPPGSGRFEEPESTPLGSGFALRRSGWWPAGSGTATIS